MKIKIGHFVAVAACVATCSAMLSAVADDAKAQTAPERKVVSQETMKAIYEEVKTPYKVGMVLLPEKNEKIDNPLTARRILAVRDAIANLGRADCFDKTNDPKGELAKKAIAADAELGNGMPEFTIDDIRQEEI